jgi:hypothetical protein
MAGTYGAHEVGDGDNPAYWLTGYYLDTGADPRGDVPAC